MSLGVGLLLAAAVCVVLALPLLRRRRRPLSLRRPRRSPMALAVAAVLIVLAILLAGLALSLRQFQRLATDHPVALIATTQLAPQRFRVALDTGDGSPREFEIAGDQWQIDARVVRWQLPALLAGAPALYRLERLSGRYADIDSERELPRTVHSLASGALSVLPDLFDIKRSHPRWLPFVDARFGSAAYLPMLDGGRFELVFNPRGGLVARAADQQTEQRLESEGW